MQQLFSNTSLSSIFSSRTRLFWLLFAVLAAVVYVPYVVLGGITMDGWLTVRAAAFGGSFGGAFTIVSPYVPHRPLFAFFQTLSGRVFYDHAWGYNLGAALVWVACILIAAAVFRRYMSERAALLFVVFAGAPCIASSSIFHAGIMFPMPVAMLLCTLSFWTLQRYLETQRIIFYIATYPLILAALLTYEVMLPLLTLSALMPLVWWYNTDFANSANSANATSFFAFARRNALRVLVRFVLPAGAMVILSTLYQRLLAQFFTSTYISNLMLKDMSIKRLAWSIGSWVYSLVFDMPVLLVSSFRYLANPYIIVALVLICVMVWTLRKDTTETPQSQGSAQRAFVLVAVLALFSCTLLYVLSVSKPNTYGYANRTMFSTFFLLCIPLAYYADKLLSGKMFWLVVVLIVPFYASTIAQRDNYIESGRMQKVILTDMAEKIKAAGVEQGANILANVPYHTAHNVNNEEVFVGWWDLGPGVRYYTNDLVEEAYSMSAMALRSVEDRQHEFIMLKVGDKPHIWYYEYNQTNGQSLLKKVNGREELSRQLDDIEKLGLNEQPPHISRYVKDLIKLTFNLKRDPVRKEEGITK